MYGGYVVSDFACPNNRCWQDILNYILAPIDYHIVVLIIKNEENSLGKRVDIESLVASLLILAQSPKVFFLCNKALLFNALLPYY
jgi:hypothetical protein